MPRKRIANPREVAKMLTRSAVGLTRSEFAKVAAYTLSENSPYEIAQVEQHIPPHLTDLLPGKYLH
jgi:hypothetical protein